MSRSRALLAAFALLLAGSSGEAALPAASGNPLSLNSREPIAVNADSFLADLNGDTGTYTGNVIVIQGMVKLHADEVRVLAPNGRASRMEAQGHVIVDSPSGQAIGDTGVYDVPQQVLHLTGNVVLTRERNVMRGTALEFSMATGLAKMTAGAPQTASATPGEPPPKPARVQGLFYPEQPSTQQANPGGASPAAPSNPANP
jgi:lipopolysaccharide export system protein LptA